MGKAEPPYTAKSTELKRRMEQTFDVEGVSTFGGLEGYLKNMGQHSTAFALQQLLKEEQLSGVQPLTKRTKDVD